MRSYLSDRCVLLEEHGTGCFQLDGGRHQNLQGPEAHLKQVITSRRRTHKRLQVDGVQDSCKAAENTKHFWFSEEEVDVEGIYSLYLQMDFSDSQRAEQEAEVVLRASPSALWTPAGSVCTGPPRWRCYCGSARRQKKKNTDFNSVWFLDVSQANVIGLTSCDRWDRSSAVTWLVVLGWGSTQWDPATCWEEEDEGAEDLLAF